MSGHPFVTKGHDHETHLYLRRNRGGGRRPRLRGAGAPETATQNAQTGAAAASDGGGGLQVDPLWPKDLAHKWLLGEAVGMAVDSRDHTWVIHRPRSLSNGERGASANPPTSECCVAAPPVLEFDQEGNVVQTWGGPGSGFDWPGSEHGIYVDYKDRVWVAGNGEKDGVVLKFTRDGKFFLQVGKVAATTGSSDLKILGGPADMTVDPKTNELIVADGYRNRRVIVFDADTGAYKRHFGAYGKPPVDGQQPPYNAQEAAPIFGTAVHCVALANDGLLYVCDRSNHRVQVFKLDGTFVKEAFLGRAMGGSSVWDIDFSRDAGQTYAYIVNGGNHSLWTVRRDTLETLATTGRRGRNAGQFESPHSVAVDSKGNVYVGETLAGRRIQKFVPQSRATTTSLGASAK